MNGQLANVIALALHGSGWLVDGANDAPELDRSNSTFRYVSWIRFDAPPRRWGRGRYFTSSRAWMSFLSEMGAERLWLVMAEGTSGPLAPHLAAGFSNGGRWGLLSSGTRTALWVPHWEVVDRPALDSRIWGVRIAGSLVDPPTQPSRPSAATALDNLESALIDIREFARGHSLDSWADRFSDAIDRAQAEQPDIPHHPDLAPQSVLSGTATRLLASASQSWVFGGMGSWNDIWLDDPIATDRMQHVTGTLYRHMLAAFVAGTNTDLDTR